MKKTNDIYLDFFASVASAQDFSSLIPFDKFSKWMNSTLIKWPV